MTARIVGRPLMRNKCHPPRKKDPTKRSNIEMDQRIRRTEVLRELAAQRLANGPFLAMEIAEAAGCKVPGIGRAMVRARIKTERNRDRRVMVVGVLP